MTYVNSARSSKGTRGWNADLGVGIAPEEALDAVGGDWAALGDPDAVLIAMHQRERPSFSIIELEFGGVEIVEDDFRPDMGFSIVTPNLDEFPAIRAETVFQATGADEVAAGQFDRMRSRECREKRQRGKRGKKKH